MGKSTGEGVLTGAAYPSTCNAGKARQAHIARTTDTLSRSRPNRLVNPNDRDSVDGLVRFIQDRTQQQPSIHGTQLPAASHLDHGWQANPADQAVPQRIGIAAVVARQLQRTRQQVVGAFNSCRSRKANREVVQKFTTPLAGFSRKRKAARRPMPSDNP